MTDEPTAAPVATEAASEQAPVRVSPFSPQIDMTPAPAEIDPQAVVAAAKLVPGRDAAIGKLDDLKAQLISALDKVTLDANYYGTAESFIQHAANIADEAIAWIKQQG